MSNVTESIFDNGGVLIPMSDVSFVEYQTHPTIGKNGIFVITKNTRYDMKADTWANPCYIHEHNKEEFIKAYCRYRAELENLV